MNKIKYLSSLFMNYTIRYEHLHSVKYNNTGREDPFSYRLFIDNNFVSLSKLDEYLEREDLIHMANRFSNTKRMKIYNYPPEKYRLYIVIHILFQLQKGCEELKAWNVLPSTKIKDKGTYFSVGNAIISS